MSREVVRRRALRAPARQRGFSLIELVAAFVVFALGFGVLMGILSASIRNTRLAADYTQAALWAQSQLDIVGIGEKLEPGRKSGRFDDRFRWELDIQKYEPPPDANAAPKPDGFQSIDMFRVDLEVLWGDRRSPRSAHFVSLRSANAEAGIVGGERPDGTLPQNPPNRGSK
ncbi:MAG TPA: prepilin-type N-terminal cleavage/methylation domain-containing protein [Tahibacter sp.]|uniref:type IV pilus modification PilV family protein n=1 Tax=Tahibacter sp. TaxID=2056211 RepID=UPI002BA307D1|nr:prepilin-type N-terminal cleavage/methylation domain-containing protein [Tahibacter sp.]HSX61132.1 prepilin-type N-terminal cleavage/methylation domain-containing protein [Tahibacter sp.]